MCAAVDPASPLGRRAAAFGVATSYQDWSDRTVAVSEHTVAAILAQLGDEPPPTGKTSGSVPRMATPPRCWGWSVQLYALHSARSWGLGDLADLRELAVRSATQLGADLILVNPLHAVAPVLPITDSPYSPTSRRYVNPLYLRIEEVPEYAAAPEAVRARVDALRLPPPDPGGLLDRDQVWTAKIGALQELWPDVRPVAADPDLLDFATFCALAERYGLPWQNWPAELRRPDAAGLPAAREQLADRVAFHAWVQVLCDEQVAAVQQAALDAGMRIGIVHDLAVGVDPGGADAWALQDVLAGQVTVGAPPDSFNQRGQDWALPPWRPDALLRTEFAPYRQMLTAILARGGGIRVDHVMGLSRLWWVPPGHTPDAGTYVSYDETALLDLLVEVATSRGGIVVGEDLGTVEPRMRTALRERGILGSAVLWFERIDDRPDGPPKPPSAWSELAVASISTHDLPTAHGWLADEQVRVRAELGQLGRPVEQEKEAAGQERAALLTALTQLGLLAPAELDDPDVVVLAMHAYLAASPALVLLASPYDVLGELRQPNLPGTTDEYPNWRLPLSVSLDALLDDPRVARTATVLRRGRDLG